jgi:4-amino-4-deoxychorismate lyase
MYRLVESIRVEKGILINVERHQRRVENSCRALYEGRGIPELEELIEVPADFVQGTVKCRFLYAAEDDSASWTAEFSHYVPRIIRTLKMVESDLDYSCKYTDRRAIDELMKQRGSCDDIVIIKNGLITDSGFSNIVFSRNNRWYTPAEPLLDGTERTALLESGRIMKADVSPEDLPKYEGFRLINAMLPFEKQLVLPIGAVI